MSILYIGNDRYITLSGLNDAADNSYLNSATVTYAIYEANGTAVSGGTGTLSYISASNGNYRGIIDAAITATLTAEAAYYIAITATQGNYDGLFRIDCTARIRGTV